MWLDADRIPHTVALEHPTIAMSPETLATLEALSHEERTKALEALDGDKSMGPQQGIPAEQQGPEGDALPDGYIRGPVRSAAELMSMVRSTEYAWRLDVILALQDYFMLTNSVKDLELLPEAVSRSAHVDPYGEVCWHRDDAADAVVALAEVGRVVRWLHGRDYDESGEFTEVVWSEHDGTDPVVARDAALGTLARGGLAGSWVLITWK